MCQTEGAPLPELSNESKATSARYRERLIDFFVAQGIELEFKESIAPALGMSYGGRIAILPGQAKAEEFSTLVHELAHEMLHKAERRTATTKTVRETEAEAIAFVVSTRPSDLDAGHRIGRLHPALPRQRLASGRELGSHSAAPPPSILAAIEPPAAVTEEAEAEPALAEAS